jgi:cystathionine beta-lyase/cystathionine gamma-synthase
LRRPEAAEFSYPALAQGQEGDIARRQISAGGRLVSFELRGGLRAGKDFMKALKLSHRAVRLGDPETVAQHPASMTRATYGAEERAKHGISDGLIRISVSLENTEDIGALDGVATT